MKFGQGQFSGRMEDLRLLTGKGRCVDDTAPEGARRVSFARSNHAHARITALDLDAARRCPGVHLVAGAADLAAMGVDLDLPDTLIDTRTGGQGAAPAAKGPHRRPRGRTGGQGAAPKRPLLARDTLRYVGEAFAVIVADTRDQARDAAERIGLDVQEIDPVTTLTPCAPAIQTELFSKVLTGIYDSPQAWLGARGVYTNTTPIVAYRGAGRPEANLPIERVSDHAARTLGVDRFILREKNVVRSFPHRLISGDSVDCGDFDHILRASYRHADAAGFAARRTASKAKGRLRGLGLACYLEAILGSRTETAHVVIEGQGATLHVGTPSNGQGHETVYARMLSTQTGIEPHHIKVVQGDGDLIPHGGGTGGSRSVTTQGTAMKATSEALVLGLAAFLTDELGQPVTFAGKVFASPGNHRLTLTLAEAADLARQKGRADLLDQSRTTTRSGGACPNGAHICEVEIDPDPGALTLDRFTVVDDFGELMAPDLVLGQIQGGVAQGFGQAVSETVVYDDQGQLLTGSFMDHAMPRADDLPFIRFFHEGVPTATNPLGGEAGTVGACGAISNAVLDALAGRGVTRVGMPFTPQRLWTWLQEAQTVPA